VSRSVGTQQLGILFNNFASIISRDQGGKHLDRSVQRTNRNALVQQLLEFRKLGPKLGGLRRRLLGLDSPVD
jgi:hypothetical protein